MELIYYARFLRRHLMTILGVMILTALVTGLAVARQPVRYQADGSVLFRLTDPRVITDYDYDQFYALQSTELFSGNIATWLNSAEAKQVIHDQAKAGSGDTIRAKKNGGAVDLRGTAGTQERATAVVAVTDEKISERVKLLSQGNTRSSFVALPAQTTVTAIHPQPLRAAGIGAASGLLLGLVLALLAEASGSRSQRPKR